MNKRTRENDVCGHVDSPHYGKGRCQPCFKAFYYQANREAVRAKNNAYAAEHREEAISRSSAWAKAHPEWHRENAREGRKRRMAADPEKERARLRLSARRLKGMLNPTDESGVGKTCAICMQVLQAGRTRQSACLDHCHATGKVRGWLCNDCNRMLGMAKDSPAILQKAIEYLQKER